MKKKKYLILIIILLIILFSTLSILIIKNIKSKTSNSEINRVSSSKLLKENVDNTIEEEVSSDENIIELKEDNVILENEIIDGTTVVEDVENHHDLIKEKNEISQQEEISFSASNEVLETSPVVENIPQEKQVIEQVVEEQPIIQQDEVKEEPHITPPQPQEETFCVDGGNKHILGDGENEHRILWYLG